MSEENVAVFRKGYAAVNRGDIDGLLVTIHPDATPPKLSADELELATRYGLSAENVKRVRGETWAEKCEDAKRLAELAKPEVNAGEKAALAAHAEKQTQRAAWWLGGGGKAP
jgi:ketosteroid isomerase-like protein